MTAIGPVVSGIICLIKNDTNNRQTPDRLTEKRHLLFHTVGIMKRRENMQIAIRRMERKLCLFTTFENRFINHKYRSIFYQI